jgi:hypothetical protein
MAKPRVYVETTIVSYLTAKESRDPIVRGHQTETVKRWTLAPDEFELVVSVFVRDEANQGDPSCAAKRIASIDNLNHLKVTTDAEQFAEALVQEGVIPPTSSEDALHIAIAVTHGVPYLVTWNCRHIANANMRQKYEDSCRAHGYRPTILCTPSELMPEEK